MPDFVVQYAAANGRTHRETVEADSERSALSRIESAGHTPISVELAASAKTGRRGRRRRARHGRAMRRAVLDFTYQLSAVAESGIPIVAGLKAVADQTGNTKLRAAIGRMVNRIEGGRTLAEALDSEPDVFPELYARTLAAGEAAGKVPEVLSSLASYQEQEAETRNQARSALMYPAMVVGSLVLATVVLLIFVVPQFTQMFARFESELPLPTRILIVCSDAIVNHYILVILGVVGLFFAARRALEADVVKEWLDKHLIRMPVFGKLLLGIYMVRFIELLDLLMQAALPITQSLRVTSDSMTNAALRRDIRDAMRSIEGGRSLSEAFAETKCLTPLVKRMMAIGEESGRTDEIFSYLRKYYGTQTKRAIKMLSTLIEPVMIMGLAGVVLFFALAIFLPMWKLLRIVGTG